jgi:hypothetical protein
MATIEGVSVEAKGSEVRVVATALRSCVTCRGVEVGELVGETESKKTIVVAADGQGPVSLKGEVPR